MQNDHLCACSFGGSVVSLKQRMRHSGREAVPQKLVWNIKEVLFRETLYFSPQFPEGCRCHRRCLRHGWIKNKSVYES
jgi:hypothetical protein